MYRNIMIPLDGSRFAERALPVATSIARRSGGRLHLVRVHHPVTSPMHEVTSVWGPGGWEDRVRREESDYVESLAVTLRERGVTAVAVMEEGEPERRLTERAREGIDLVVLATHARTGLARAWLGSVSDAVTRAARVPVILVNPESQDGQELTFRHVLVAADGSPASEAAADEGARLASLFGGRVTLLSVVIVPMGAASPYIPHAARMNREEVQRRAEQAEQQLDRTAARLRDVVPVERRAERGYHAPRAILRMALEAGCDLVAVGTHGRHGVARALLGSVADEVVRGSPYPVMVVHDAA